MLTQERADIISKYLTDDQARAERLLGMEAEEALNEINSDGYDFSAEELNEYCEALNATIAQGELKADDLDSVAGGVAVSIGICIACGVAGAVAGFITNKSW